MAVDYVSMKCTSCPSTKFEYLSDQKMWRCLYCGTLVERHEQADTMFTIKNVVRQSILDDAWMRFDSSQKNLVECEKIDSRYIGTIIAEIAYEVNMLYYGGLNKAQQSNMFAQMKKNYIQLKSMAPVPNDEEIALYEFMESSEATGILILMFDVLKDKKRIDLLFNYFDPTEVYSAALNSKLLSYSIKQGNFELFDKIITNTDNIEKNKCIRIILSNYPDTPQKAENIKILLNGEKVLTEDDTKYIEKYFSETKDSSETKCSIALLAVESGASISVDVLFNNILSELESVDSSKALIDCITGRQLLDAELYKIIDYALMKCSGEICLYVFEKLIASDNYVVMTYENMLSLLKNKKMNTDIKKEIFNAALKCNITEKHIDKSIAAYMCEIDDTPENRSEMIPFMLSKVKSLSTNATEKYLLTVGVDNEKKPMYIKSIFNMNINRSVFRDIANNYLCSTDDEHKVKYEIICILQSHEIGFSADACVRYMQNNKYSSDQKIEMIRKLCEYSFDVNELYSKYISAIDQGNFDTHLNSEMMSSVTAVSGECLRKYVLNIPDLPTAKSGYIRKMAGIVTVPICDIECSVNYMDSVITCNPAQAYVLTTKDGLNDASAVISALGGSASYGRDIKVNGSKSSFSKFMRSQKKIMSPELMELCKASGIL